MTHLDDDKLIPYALGEETPDAGARDHLQICSRCADELAALERLVIAGRTVGDVELVRPPDSVWQAIHSELGLPPELRHSVVAAPVEPAATDSPSAARDHSHRPHRPRRRRWTPTVLLAAASLVVGVVAGIVGAGMLSAARESRTVAETELEPFPGWEASGSARVEEDSSGTRRIVVDLTAPGGELTEVWLLDPETSGLVSLGLLSGESGAFALPENIDLSRYSVVDVSREPDDGNPAHSGDSIVRGQLDRS